MIEYFFDFPNGESLNLSIDVERRFTAGKDQTTTFWTALEYHQCENCPLKNTTHRNCPAAADLQEVINKFNQFTSFDSVLVRVVTPEREYRKQCDIQTGLNAVLGLVMATSACPILGQLKTMARFHLPFATLDETVYRVVGNYLLQQYFNFKDGKPPDMELMGLDRLYEDIETVNIAFAERIRNASAKDANINAIVRLSGLAFLVRASIKKQLLAHRSKLTGG